MILNFYLKRKQCRKEEIIYNTKLNYFRVSIFVLGIVSAAKNQFWLSMGCLIIIVGMLIVYTVKEQSTIKLIHYYLYKEPEKIEISGSKYSISKPLTYIISK